MNSKKLPLTLWSPPWWRAVQAWLAFALLTANASAQASPATGSISGRVLNAGTGDYLRNAVVNVMGTDLSTLTEAGGYYTLGKVPVGVAQLRVTYTDLEPMQQTVTVSAGATATQDFSLMGTQYETGNSAVKMSAFTVATAREGAAKALQDQRTSLDSKTILSSDAFGDVSEGNVAEFLKYMPGISLDYVEADARSVSIGGMDPKYTVVLMDGMPLASAGSANPAVGRTFEFEQLSIASIEAVELAKTPTPDVSGSALAGVVNLRSKGAFDRKGRRINFLTSISADSQDLTLGRTPGPGDQRDRKLNPNLTLGYSDVLFNGKVGVLAGYNYSKAFIEERWIEHGYAFNSNPRDNATEVARMTNFQILDGPKTTERANYNLRLDYKLSPELSVYAKVDYNTYEALYFSRNYLGAFGSTIVPGSEFSWDSQTTSGTNATGLRITHGGNAFQKHGATTTTGAGMLYTKGNFEGSLQAAKSYATNEYDTISDGFFAQVGGNPVIANATVRWDRSSPMSPMTNLYQLTGADWTNPKAYPKTVASGNVLERKGSATKETLRGDLRENFASWKLPTVVKFGGNIERNLWDYQRRLSYNVTYLGADRIANTGDEYPALFLEPTYRTNLPWGGNLQNLQSYDRFAFAKEYKDHPDRFVVPSLLQQLLQTRNYVKEQISSGYGQVIIKVTGKLTVAPGFRVEQNRSLAYAPQDIGDPATRLALTGSKTGTVVTTSDAYIIKRYGSLRENKSAYSTPLKYLHLSYNATTNLKLRASYNDSVTRPNVEDLSAAVAINDAATPPTVTIGNPDLVQEESRSLFGEVSYFFAKGTGSVSVSVTRRDLKNKIGSLTRDLPLDETGTFAEFAGYRLTTRYNIGKAHVSSAEFNYRQRLTFLPGVGKRISIFGNYTGLQYDDYENFRRPSDLANGGFSMDFRRVSFDWKVNWVPAYSIVAPTPTTGWRSTIGARLNHDAQINVRLPYKLVLFITGRNVFDAPTKSYFAGGTGAPKVLNRYSDYGSMWTLGLKGTF